MTKERSKGRYERLDWGTGSHTEHFMRGVELRRWQISCFLPCANMPKNGVSAPPRDAPFPEGEPFIPSEGRTKGGEFSNPWYRRLRFFEFEAWPNPQIQLSTGKGGKSETNAIHYIFIMFLYSS